MKTYVMTIEPLTPFGTPLKGDTLFGHFCWQVANDPTLLAQPLDEAISIYPERPFALFSSAYPLLPDGSYALKRPDAPLELLFDLLGRSREEIIENRKSLKKRKWLVCGKPAALADFKTCQWLDDDGLAGMLNLAAGKHLLTEVECSHNSINRLTGTTGEGFAPYTQDNLVYAPGIRLVVFAGIDEQLLSVESLQTGLERIGTFGYGRDASSGLGKFRVAGIHPVDLAQLGAREPNALYTLAPSVPDAGLYRDALFTPFTRFGRHGDRLAVSGNPFKNPVIMADEGALFFPHEMATALTRPYIGTAVSGISKSREHSVVHQGYSLYIPVRLEVY